MKAALAAAMKWLAEQPDTVFLGQSVAYPGTTLYDTLAGIAATKRIEMPVAEDMQLGFSTGLALAGFVPISIFPRWNFLLLAANQLVNHLDRLPLYSGYRPKLIVRVAAGKASPLDPGPQHQGDFSDAFRLLLKTVRIVQLGQPKDVLPAYQVAYRATYPTILVE